MILTPAINEAVPFGLQSAALANAADIARAYEDNPHRPAEHLNVRPSINVVPYSAPYGPWWVIQVVCGASVMFVGN